jgi:hypothetical protein
MTILRVRAVMVNSEGRSLASLVMTILRVRAAMVNSEENSRSLASLVMTILPLSTVLAKSCSNSRSLGRRGGLGMTSLIMRAALARN